ncbi:MAG TPA: metalloregulator ArsR/SmtB family transcription factor [Acidimicrobiia bacterium]|jgi:rhodanese-related sulfurtransferase|nr:metalloregulator ArsR/SmtB family transcription factor [Acidimicrobiia bacterium]
MGSRAEKDRLFDGFAEIGKALASGRRLELLDVLAQGPRSVEHLADEIGQSVANTSAHLRTLATAGLVTTRRDGNRVVYALAGPSVEALWAALRATGSAHVATLDRLAGDYLGDRRELEVMTRAELADRLRRGDPPVVLDVRPSAEYAAGHIPGALSVPPEEVAARLRRLPRDSDVVAYCRGPFCVYADDAVRQLRRRKVKARRLEDGFPEWRKARLPVAVGVDDSASLS